MIEVLEPVIEDHQNIPVIPVMVCAGDKVEKEQSIQTLELDKATIEVQSSYSGIAKEVEVKIGDLLSHGGSIIALEDLSQALDDNSNKRENASDSMKIEASTLGIVDKFMVADGTTLGMPTDQKINVDQSISAKKHVSRASPYARKFAREFGVNVGKIFGSGLNGRVTKEDIRKFIKKKMSSGFGGSQISGSRDSNLDLLPWPKVDFTKFGQIEHRSLSRIQKKSAANLARNWVMIPSVTYHDDADITDLEVFRAKLNQESKESEIKITLLAFMIKAAAVALKKYPTFNASLDGEDLLLKSYFHIGFAVDTPNGLIVPTIRDVNQKGIFQIAKETTVLASLARDGKLKSEQMQGASFTISSLGGIGGTYCAPIINAPEVAILAVNKSAIKPIWDGAQFIPRLICPLSMTADHRVIDGATATHFTNYLAQLLADFRKIVL